MVEDLISSKGLIFFEVYLGKVSLEGLGLCKDYESLTLTPRIKFATLKERLGLCESWTQKGWPCV